MDTAATEPYRAPSRFYRAPVLVAMLAYPALRAIAGETPEVGVVLTFSAVAYVLAIYLYYGIAMLAFRGQNLWLLAGTIGGAAAGVIAGEAKDLWFVLASWAAVLIPGIVAGRMLAAGRSAQDLKWSTQNIQHCISVM